MSNIMNKKKWMKIVIFSQMIVFCLISTVVMADSNPLLKEVYEYGKRVDDAEKSVGKIPLEKLIQEGTSIADKLQSVIEKFSDADYDFVVKNMKGFIVNREEAIIIEPNTAFFVSLAKKVGIEKDLLYFHFLSEVKPDGVWPIYIKQQTDLGGCTKYGEGFLSNLYKKGEILLPKIGSYYGMEVKKILKDLSDRLIAETCACGERPLVIKELRLFLELNKKSEITEKIRKRLEEIQKSKTDMKYNCIGGV